MVRSRRFALIRIPALLLLLWVGFDIGAHGLLVSDFEPLSSSGPSSRLSPDPGTTATHVPHNHCFCHGISVGAVLPALTGSLAASGAVVLPLSSRVPRGDHHPLDHPPQLIA